MKQSEALELVALLEAAYRQELPESSRMVYADFLSEHPMRAYESKVYEFDAVSSLRDLIRASRFFPTIAEIEEQFKTDSSEARQQSEWENAAKQLAAPALPPARPTPEQLEAVKRFADRFGVDSKSAEVLKQFEETSPA